VSVNKRRNYQKYANPNPLQRWLLNKFQLRVADLVAFSVGHKDGAPCVLDVGCGEGYVLEYLRERQPQVRFCGVDLDSEALKLAKARNTDVPFYRGDALNLPFADSSFNLVMCLEVLEHLESPWLAVEELARVSSRDLLVSVPNHPFFSLANFLRGKNWPTWGDDPEHVQRWWGRGFVSCMGEKISISRVVYAFPWVIVLGNAKHR
jgi:SAM-dependent methyltransferase